MNDFLRSLKSDLLDRRLLPVVAVLGVALIAAVAYAVLGSGGSSTSSTPPAAIGVSSGASGATGAIAITQAPAGSSKAVAETTSGSSQQGSGRARDPFTPLPSAKAKSASVTPSSSTSSSSSAGTSSSSGSANSTPSPGGSTPVAPAPKPVTPAKKLYIHYHVTAQFGVVPAAAEGTTPQPAQLKTYADMALDEPLPGKDDPQAVYLGVVLSNGKEAVFGLTGEAILHGSATCKPSPTQCQAIALQIGQSERLEVVEADGQAVTYELKLVSIAKSIGTASAARAHVSRAQARAARSGRAFLNHVGLSALAGRYSTEKGSVRSGK